MKSANQYQFANVPGPQIQRSVFKRPYNTKTTFNEKFLYPFFVDEVLPGDTKTLHMTAFVRLLTLIAPIMDNIMFDVFWFFVPTRLVWDNWEKFQGAQDNPGDSTDFLIPSYTLPPDGIAFPSLSLYDYFGLPTQTFLAQNISCLPERAYRLIWNAWFRDENLQNKVTISKGDGPDALNVTGTMGLLPRGKRHDYFASCLPWPQKGDSVALPLGTSAPVIGNSKAISLIDDGGEHGSIFFSNMAGVGHSPLGIGSVDGANKGAAATDVGSATMKYAGLSTDPNKSGMIVDLNAATAATINQIRQAFAYQSILEKDARGGTRYTEMLKAHFGVTNPDFRLQRPEYLGGSSQRINISQVAQTSRSEGGAATPQATLAAFGATTSNAHFHKSFTEHGFILGLMNARADVTYQQGLRRMWTRRTRFDHYMPALAHLGEQAVLRKEIYAIGDTGITGDESVFGYNERWSEYKYMPNNVTGQFRSAYSTPLHFWHLALNFTSNPSLNDAFIQDSPPISRVVSVPSEDHFMVDILCDITDARPMPMYSIPAQLGRF